MPASQPTSEQKPSVLHREKTREAIGSHTAWEFSSLPSEARLAPRMEAERAGPSIPEGSMAQTVQAAFGPL